MSLGELVCTYEKLEWDDFDTESAKRLKCGIRK